MDKNMKKSKLATDIFEQLNKEQQAYVGETFEALDMAEMETLQGAGDIEGETTPATISSAPCGAGISVITSYIISKITK